MDSEGVARELVAVARELVAAGSRIKRSPSGDYILCKLLFKSGDPVDSERLKEVKEEIRWRKVVGTPKLKIVGKDGLLVSYKAQVRFGPDFFNEIRDKVIRIVESLGFRFSKSGSDCELDPRSDWQDPDTDYKMLGIRTSARLVARPSDDPATNELTKKVTKDLLRVMKAVGGRLGKQFPGTDWGAPYAAEGLRGGNYFDVRVPMEGGSEWGRLSAVQVSGWVKETGSGFGRRKVTEPTIESFDVDLRFPGHNYRNLKRLRKMPTAAEVLSLVKGAVTPKMLGEEVEKDELDLAALRGLARKHMRWFQEEDADKEEVTWATREHGDVGSEEAGAADVAAAYDFAREVKKKFPGVSVEVEEVDEWVNVTVSA